MSEVKKEFEVVPYISIGDLQYGMPRSKVREQLGNYTVFKKSEENDNDDFGFCHTFYDNQENLIAVEFWEQSKFNYRGKSFTTVMSKQDFATTLNIIVKDLEDRTNTAWSGFTSEELGLSAYCSCGKIESVLFHKKGYYDNLEL